MREVTAYDLIADLRREADEKSAAAEEPGLRDATAAVYAEDARTLRGQARKLEQRTAEIAREKAVARLVEDERCPVPAALCPQLEPVENSINPQRCRDCWLNHLTKEPPA